VRLEEAVARELKGKPAPLRCPRCRKVLEECTVEYTDTVARRVYLQWKEERYVVVDTDESTLESRFEYTACPHCGNEIDTEPELWRWTGVHERLFAHRLKCPGCDLCWTLDRLDPKKVRRRISYGMWKKLVRAYREKDAADFFLFLHEQMDYHRMFGYASHSEWSRESLIQCLADEGLLFGGKSMRVVAAEYMIEESWDGETVIEYTGFKFIGADSGEILCVNDHWEGEVENFEPPPAEIPEHAKIEVIPLRQFVRTMGNTYGELIFYGRVPERRQSPGDYHLVVYDRKIYRYLKNPARFYAREFKGGSG